MDSTGLLQVALTVPREIITDPVEVPASPTANSYQMKRGQFRLTFRVPEPDAKLEHAARPSTDRPFLQNLEAKVLTEKGEKRIYIYSISQRAVKPVNGEETLEITAVFSVLDNPIWIVPALYALTAAIGTIGGWFLIDKVESFSGTTVGAILTFLVVALTGFVLFKSL